MYVPPDHRIMDEWQDNYSIDENNKYIERGLSETVRLSETMQTNTQLHDRERGANVCGAASIVDRGDARRRTDTHRDTATTMVIECLWC